MIFDLIGGLLESGASKDAAKIQSAAGDRAVSEVQRQFDLSRSDMSPWMNSGRNALRKLDGLLGTSGDYNQAWNSANNAYLSAYNEYQALSKSPYSPARDQRMSQLSSEISRLQGEVANLNPADYANGGGELLKDFGLADFQADPGYQFRLGEGTKAIENSAAARGMQLSGANLKALNRFGQDFASNEYDQAWNRDSLEKQRKYNYLTGQSGSGQQTSAQMGQLGQNASARNAANYLDIGNAQAAGRMGGTMAWTNALRGVQGSAFKMMGMS